MNNMSSNSLEEHIFNLRQGKWSQRTVPHHDWKCVGIEDLGSPLKTCEMCESQAIRYVHYMQHVSYSNVLGVGCVCAGHMTGDLAAARSRESSMRSRAGKRSRWLSRAWKISKKGNEWLEADGFRIAIYPRGAAWTATIVRGDEPPVHSRTTFPTQNQAKLNAFDQITNALIGKFDKT